jgi:hypothetical protein
MSEENTEQPNNKKMYNSRPNNRNGVKKLKDVTIKAKLIGRNNTPIEPEKVQKLAAMGCRDADISRFFGIDQDLLKKNFAREVELGREEMKIALRRAMFTNAVENNVSQVQIFLAKNILGMSDNPVNTEDKKPLPWNDSDED